MKKRDLGLIGLRVMGENLVKNMDSKGFTVAVYNRTLRRSPILSKVGEGQEHRWRVFHRGTL
jgi:6-phosphogluconate dehydrogenase